MNKPVFAFLLLPLCLVLPVSLLMIDASAIPTTPDKPLLVATNQGDRDLSIIDPAADKQLATVPEGGITGHEVATSPDGRTAYVPIYGNSGVGRPGTDGREMVVIDIPSRAVTGKVDFGHGVRPHCPVYDRASGMLYVTTELDQTVTIIDPKTLKIVGTVPTGQKESHMLVISRDGRLGYTSNVGPGTVSVLDLPGRKTIAVIPISREAQRIAISNDDKLVFTSDQTKPQLAVIDTATNKIKTWVARCWRGRTVRSRMCPAPRRNRSPWLILQIGRWKRRSTPARAWMGCLGLEPGPRPGRTFIIRRRLDGRVSGWSNP
jgi:YVTN family beta-propeller protein